MIRNTTTQWGWPAKVLHWIGAGAILILLVHGWWMTHRRCDLNGSPTIRGIPQLVSRIGCDGAAAPVALGQSDAEHSRRILSLGSGSQPSLGISACTY